ncbi:MAG TPA: hypothetical protein VHX88_12995 [Solirubrobacteraceae bacterium]|jgi:hypothetical protein|nr:hypothetical protein [Solirubrobacteraceae bacterium]
MKRKLTLVAAGLAAGAVVGVVPALATITEVGTTTDTTPPSCPSKCLAVSRTTGYQAKIGTQRSLMIVPKSGRIVAWSITQGTPTKKQITYFDQTEGGAPEAGIAVLKGGKGLEYDLVASSPFVNLQPYFGETAQFPLNTTIPVTKGEVIALTVPTWAPALAIGFTNTTSWRASRPKSGCNNTTTQTADETVGTTVQYYCLYQTARLTYSATLVTTP